MSQTFKSNSIASDMLVKYFNKFFSLYFIDYPSQFVPDISQFYLQSASLFWEDVKAKYPKTDENIVNGDQLFYTLQIEPCLEAIFYYRIQRNIFLKDPEHPLLPFLAALSRIKTGIELYYSTEIGPGLNIQHGVGIVIGPRNKIGKNLIIHQGATIGQGRLHAPEDTITIGDNVTIFAGAKIVGNLTIGNHVQIGANAVLRHDAESNAIYAGVPAKKIRFIK